MKKWISIFALTTALHGCWCQPTNTAVNTTAAVLQATSTSIEAAQSTAVLYYRFEQERILSDGLREGWTRDHVRDRIALLRLRWTPTWMLFEEARTAYNELVALLQLAGDGKKVEQELGAAYAKLQKKLGDAESALAAARGDQP